MFLVLICAMSAGDPALARLLEEAVAASPEVAQARAEVQAERLRAPQAGAWADPTLTLGIQNDGFNGLQIGTAETSWYTIMLSQPIDWPGKRGLREQVASLDVRRAEARLARALLGVEGRVRRASIGLLLARGQLALLDEQERLWAQAEQTARARYESGQVPQSDLLRSQLERARLQLRRAALEASREHAVAELNRLRGRALHEPIAVEIRLDDLPDPPLPDSAAVEARSPELQLARLSVEQSDRRVDLARKERLPDFSVTAAVMPRGSLEPMWQLGVSVGLPIFSRRRQAVEAGEQQRIAESQGEEALRQVLRLRAHEWVTTLTALNRVNQEYRAQVLVLSAASARSTLAQYEVGRVPFAAVLEALSGYVTDRASYLGSIADAQLVAIAQQEARTE